MQRPTQCDENLCSPICFLKKKSYTGSYFPSHIVFRTVDLSIDDHFHKINCLSMVTRRPTFISAWTLRQGSDQKNICCLISLFHTINWIVLTARPTIPPRGRTLSPLKFTLFTETPPIVTLLPPPWKVGFRNSGFRTISPPPGPLKTFWNNRSSCVYVHRIKKTIFEIFFFHIIWYLT